MKKVSANFQIEYIQYLNNDGSLMDGTPDICNAPQTLVELYKHMVLMRAFDAKAIKLQRTGKMGTYASILGQEAISCSVGQAMAPEDVLVPYYRDYGAQTMRATSMLDIYRYWGGNELGNHFSDSSEDLPICVPIASQCLHATGIATAMKYRDESRVVVVSIGEGGTSEGDFYEALNVAGAWQLPVIFLVHNNQWAISVPVELQTSCETFAQKAIAAGIDGVQVDGNDFLATRQLMGEVIEEARNNSKPCVVEAKTYRLHDHTTADDASRYRDNEEVDNAWKNEPLARAKKYLMANQLWDESTEQDWLADCEQQVQETTQAYLDTPAQEATSMFDHLYQTLPEVYEDQRRELEASS